METLLGIRGPNFAMLAADSTHLRGICVLKDDVNKIIPIADNLMITAIGGSGDAPHLVDFLKRSLAFYRVRNGYQLSPRAAAHFARKSVAEYQRSLNNYQVNLLLAGYDKDDGPDLFYIDNLANSVPLNCGAQGYGAAFCSSIFDRYWKKDLTQKDAYEIFEKLICELKKRFFANYKKFNVYVVDKDGIRDLEPILVKDQND